MTSCRSATRSSLMDPPKHKAHRGLLMRLITPKRLRKMKTSCGATLNCQIDENVERGECEFILDRGTVHPQCHRATSWASPRGTMSGPGRSPGGVVEPPQRAFGEHRLARATRSARVPRTSGITADVGTAGASRRRPPPGCNLRDFPHGSLPEVDRGRPASRPTCSRPGRRPRSACSGRVADHRREPRHPGTACCAEPACSSPASSRSACVSRARSKGDFRLSRTPRRSGASTSPPARP